MGVASDPLGVAIVGCGAISSVYAGTLRRSAAVRVVGCADIDHAAAVALARRQRIAAFESVDALIADPRVDIVVVLTPPLAHPAGIEAALDAGKHVYSEKPLASTGAEGARLVEKASRNGLRLAVAPDTVLGASWQTAGRLLDEGAVGECVAAEAAFVCPGHELWHPNPGFYYRRGGGPLFDMGPYYLSALVRLLGPVHEVDAAAQVTSTVRRPTEGPNAGSTFPVEVPTHVVAALRFAAPVIATLTMSFDVWPQRSSRLLVYGAKGTLVLPDPNGFLGHIEIRGPGGRRDRVAPDPFAVPQRRGLGVVDLATSIAAERPHSASAELALHVLETMEAIVVAAESGRRQRLRAPLASPLPLKAPR